MEKTRIDLGLGVSIEKIVSDCTRIHNLKSNNDSVMNLGARFFE